jgi:hypothetical protein
MKNKFFMLSLLTIATITLLSFSYKSLAEQYELTNDEDYDMVALGVYDHDNDEVHVLVFEEGDELKSGETQSFDVDGIEGDYDILGLTTEGEVVEFDFTADELAAKGHKPHLDKKHQKPVHHKNPPKKNK